MRPLRRQKCKTLTLLYHPGSKVLRWFQSWESASVCLYCPDGKHTSCTLCAIHFKRENNQRASCCDGVLRRSPGSASLSPMQPRSSQRLPFAFSSCREVSGMVQCLRPWLSGYHWMNRWISVDLEFLMVKHGFWSETRVFKTVA